MNDARHMPAQVVISTGSRLHFGLFAHGRTGDREFGGVGVMIDRPGFVLRVSASANDILPAGPWQPRLAELLERLRADKSRGAVYAPVRIELHTAPPRHAGLGSGTQLAMALARGLSLLAGEAALSAEDLARRAGRGLRSALGLHGFVHGGLMVDAGQSRPGEISPLETRVDFPADWRFVLVRPRSATGLSGSDEAGGFARLGPMPQGTTADLRRLALTEIVPAAIERDFERAARSIQQFGQIVGHYFAPVQGGVLAHEAMRDLAGRLAVRGIGGCGQSSWGPTLFILRPDERIATQLLADLAAEPSCSQCELTIAAPLNRGAEAIVSET
jgi:beta-ribofuranosylaminobenzene 5'-phosphate synthase